MKKLTEDMKSDFHYSFVRLFLYLICSVLVICHFNIKLTGAGVMHEAGYVDSIWST